MGRLFTSVVLLLIISCLIPSISSECIDCPPDAPVKWTSVQNCGCDFRGPQGPQGTQGNTGPRGARGPFGPGTASPLNPITTESTELVDVYHSSLFSISPLVTFVPYQFGTINTQYENSTVRVLFTADILDRCPGTDANSTTGVCNTPNQYTEGVDDLTFAYDLYSSGGSIVNQSLAGATLLDTQVVQFRPKYPDHRFVTLQAAVHVGLASDQANRNLYLVVRFNNVATGQFTPASLVNRRMSIKYTYSLLGFPLALGSQKKRELDAQYKQYFLEEEINPSAIETNFL